jgi:hypothetical protein
MELLKLAAIVAVSAAVGTFVGDKVFAAIESKLPAQVPKAGAKIGLEAAGATVTFVVIKSMI